MKNSLLHHPPLRDWDESHLRAIAVPGETTELEKKASSWLDPENRPEDTIAELGKQVCAFSNSADGFLVYGILDKGGFDQGVPEITRKGTSKAWIEKILREVLDRAISLFDVRFLSLDGIHQPEFGVMVVWIPLSSHRPHWVRADEKAYLRGGEHSFPMRRQTFLDIASRGEAPQAAVDELGLKDRGTDNQGERSIRLNPIVRLLTGPIAKEWAFEIEVEPADGRVSVPGGHLDSTISMLSDSRAQITSMDRPLFPHFPKQVFPKDIWLILKPQAFERCVVTARLYAGEAQPVVIRFRLAECKVRENCECI
jgi:Putative DNA-binding domain